MNDSIKSLVRHILSAAGGYLVAKGLVSADQLPEIVGAVLTLIAAGWGIMSKKKSAE
jgi:hypothetical protein